MYGYSPHCAPTGSSDEEGRTRLLLREVLGDTPLRCAATACDAHRFPSSRSLGSVLNLQDATPRPPSTPADRRAIRFGGVVAGGGDTRRHPFDPSYAAAGATIPRSSTPGWLHHEIKLACSVEGNHRTRHRGGARTSHFLQEFEGSAEERTAAHTSASLVASRVNSRRDSDAFFGGAPTPQKGGTAHDLTAQQYGTQLGVGIGERASSRASSPPG